MPATVIVGAQWGDEGKGKIVDLLAQESELVCRYQGGPNAGHTVVVGDETYKIRQIPTGVIAGKRCAIGAGCVVDPAVLISELDELESRGHETTGLVFVSGNAHLVMPWHIALDGARERRLGRLQIGTTRRGIGPAYADKATRIGIRVQDLLDPKILRQKLELAVEEKNVWLQRVYELEPFDVEDVVSTQLGFAVRLAPYVADTSLLVDRALREGERVLFEGAQGTLLDLDHGTYPFVTSSSPIAAGAAVSFGIGPKRIDEVLGVAKAERCTALYGVPTMFIAELAHPEFDRFDLSSLRTGVMAGSPCPVEVMKACVDRMHMTDVTICYGMTETSPVSTQTLPDDSLHHRTATVGRAHPHVEIRIADPETRETLETGATGEFCTRGYSVMQGYWNDPERTADAIDDEGWMHTGDLAVMADDGYVNIVGRIKDMVIRGGENVYPREIEEFLYTHPDIEDVQVIGVPDERYGEELMAWVRLRPGATLDVEDVRAFCQGRIAHFKVPRYVKVVTEFPMTVTGKVQKFKMREQAMDELGVKVVETA